MMVVEGLSSLDRRSVTARVVLGWRADLMAALRGGSQPQTPVPPGEKGTPPMLELITATATAEPEAAVRGTLDELAREGARRMIETALQLEVEE